MIVTGSIVDGFLTLDIEDDGPGMSEDEQIRAQKRGERLDEQVPGSGLGLSIVRDLVNAYDGKFSFGIASIGGLKATISFPIQQVKTS